MNTQNNVWGWGVGIVIVLVIIGGIWFFADTTPGGPMATTTPTGATSTPSTSNTPTASEARTGSTVRAVVASLSEGSTFNSMLSSTGVSATLTGKGPFTIFVPVNNAFNNLPAGTIANMTAAQKRVLVQHHVISGKMLDIDALSSGKHTALSKLPLNFSVDVDQGMAFVNSGLAIKQYRASNGVVYLIGSVLVPPVVAAPGTGTN